MKNKISNRSTLLPVCTLNTNDLVKVLFRNFDFEFEKPTLSERSNLISDIVRKGDNEVLWS